MSRILIVDDEAILRRTLGILLLEQRYEVMEAGSGEEALARLEGDFHADLMLLDLSLPGVGGLETLRRLRERDQRTAVILMTAFGTIPSAVEAMRLGAFDYLSKPFRNDEMLLGVRRALEMQRLSSEVQDLRSELEAVYGFNEIIGVSPQIREVFHLMAKLAPLNATVLITGESGTGKELVARAIHRHSQRSAASFVAVNCSAVPPTLVESEFFGHEKGAFTDAHARRIGRFEEADGGTLFLDEVGDLALEAQAKLLRALQERQIRRVGGDRPQAVDVRVIAATNKDLAQEVGEKRFRDDLFWRLNVVPLRLPPLRERREDLPLLIDHFIARFDRELGLEVKSMEPQTLQLLLQYPWPGNVRELENTLCHAMILCDGKVLTPADLPGRLRGSSAGSEADAVRLTLAEAVRQATERLERAMIIARLAEIGGNRGATAESLGISRRTLFSKMRRYGLPDAGTAGGPAAEGMGHRLPIQGNRLPTNPPAAPPWRPSPDRVTRSAANAKSLEKKDLQS
ncbi:MAG TPA: sigma-54 dependent transcriptional regulator [Thermoanaerobaculia bacterium]|nr:sigma-54 dependent transcriptional regulator [Thermoanaerobaculia bacterium]